MGDVATPPPRYTPGVEHAMHTRTAARLADAVFIVALTICAIGLAAATLHLW